MLRGACLSSEEESQGAEATGLGPGKTLRAHRPAGRGLAFLGPRRAQRWVGSGPSHSSDREGRTNDLLNTTSGQQVRQETRWSRRASQPLLPRPSLLQVPRVQLPFGPTYSPGIVPATAAQSVPRRARKKSRGSWLSGGVSLGPLFVGPQGRVGWAAHQGAAIVELQFCPCSRTCGDGLWLLLTTKDTIFSFLHRLYNCLFRGTLLCPLQKPIFHLSPGVCTVTCRHPSHLRSAGLPVCFTVGDRWPFKQVSPPPTSMHKSIIRGGISTHEVSLGMLVDLPRLLVKAVLTLLLVAFLGHMLPPHEHLFLASLQTRGRSGERGPAQGIIWLFSSRSESLMVERASVGESTRKNWLKKGQSLLAWCGQQLAAPSVQAQLLPEAFSRSNGAQLLIPQLEKRPLRDETWDGSSKHRHINEGHWLLPWEYTLLT